LIARGKNALFGEGAGGLCDLLLLFAQIFRRKDIFRPKIFMRKLPPVARFAVNVATVELNEFSFNFAGFRRCPRRHAAADAHGHEAVFRFAALELGQQGCGELGAGAAQWMTERDGAAIDVDALGIDAERLDDGERLRGEGLVELDHVDLVEREARDFEGLGNSVHGPMPISSGSHPA